MSELKGVRSRSVGVDLRETIDVKTCGSRRELEGLSSKSRAAESTTATESKFRSDFSVGLLPLSSREKRAGRGGVPGDHSIFSNLPKILIPYLKTMTIDELTDYFWATNRPISLTNTVQ